MSSMSLRVIKAEDNDFVYDTGAGGVLLAKESVVKISGSVKHKPGQAEPQLKELLRYNKLTMIPESKVQSILQSIGGKIICFGKGKELYKDPGQGTEAVVILAPSDAVREALTVAGSALDFGNLVINFAGGDDAQVLEVLDAVKQMTLMLDIATKAKIKFNSISYSDLPAVVSSVTVIALPEESSIGGLTGVEKAIATGEIYYSDERFWTTLEEDRNTSVA
jgi:hypothetical protein